MKVQVHKGRFTAFVKYPERQIAGDEPPSQVARPVMRHNYFFDDETLKQALGASLYEKVSEEARQCEQKREWIYRGHRPIEIFTPHEPENPRHLVDAPPRGYYDKMADPTEILRAAADLFEMTVEELTAVVRKHKAAVEPVTAPRLKWEIDRLPDEDPPHFVARAYAVEAKAGKLHRGIIYSEDRELHRRLNSWLRSHDMPEGIDIPTKPEWDTRQIKAGRAKPAPTPRTEGQRLYGAEKTRRWRLPSETPSPAPGVVKAAAVETTSRVKEPPRLKWEKHAKVGEDPAHFAARAGYQHRGSIHDNDPALSLKLSNWLRTHDWPKNVRYIPTLPEWNEKQAAKLAELLATVGIDVQEVQRLAAVVMRRSPRGGSAPAM
jgi:hypothetical protein